MVSDLAKVLLHRICLLFLWWRNRVEMYRKRKVTVEGDGYSERIKQGRGMLRICWRDGYLRTCDQNQDLI